MVSAILHLALASALFYFVASDIATIEELVRPSIKVVFVPVNPLLSQAEESIPEPFLRVLVLPLVEPSWALPVAESQLESNQTDVPEIGELELAEAPPPETSIANSLPPLETVTLPSVESVQRVLSNLLRSDASRFYTCDCNKLEEESEFNDCASSDAPDYSLLTRNPVYDFYNPAIEISRTRATVTALARQSARVSELLALSGLPAGLSSYVLEELEQGIETYSNTSSRAVDHMNTMIDKSAAGVMARRLFTPWVQQQLAMLQSRRVENRTDR